MKNGACCLLLFIALSISRNSSAQSTTFRRTENIPVVVGGVLLNNPWAGGINFPLFSEIDLNGDGIHDLFLFDRVNNRVSTFLNDGTPGTQAWHYAPQYALRFPSINKWVLLFDYNCDGKMDLFTLSPCQCGIAVYRNDFNALAGGLQFTLVTPTLLEENFILTNVFTSAVSIPAFGDVDGDGDMDIIGYNSLPDGRMLYHRNYSMEHNHGCDSLEFKFESGAWGKFKLQIGGANVVACFGCRSVHHLPENNYLDHYDQSEAARKDDTISSVFMIDIDGDGDQDLLFGDQNSANSLLVLNGRTATSPDSMVSQDPSFPNADVPVNLSDFTVHASIDVDNDGVKDLLVAPTQNENLKGIWFYKNTQNNPHHHFSFQSNSFLVDQMIDVGEGACQVLFDADGDGLLDMVVGNFGVFNSGAGVYTSGLHLFKNTGTTSSPAFQLVDEDYAGINSLTSLIGPIYPAFGDLDRDGDKDMIIGENSGKLQYFNNSGGAGQPANFQLTIPNFDALDVGSSSTPQLIDLNRDQLLDLVIGNKNGFIKYFQNTGTTTAPFFSNIPTIDTLGGINVQLAGTPDGYAVPFFFDDHGVYKLLVSCGKGDVYLYDQIDGNLTGDFHLVDTVISGTEGKKFQFNLAVSGGDLNNDSLTDMVLGIYSGGIQIYMQNNPVGIEEASTLLNPGMMIVPNPANDQCTIEILNLTDKGKSQIHVLNYLGQPVISKMLQDDRVIVDTKELPSGIYMIQLISPANSFARLLVVSH